MAKIFIVEDDEKIRKELKTFLEKNGHFCTVANDFENIIDKVLNSDTELVLLDINLPRYDGFHICREIRKASSIPIIIVTSRDSEIDELMSINWGADDFITKPYNTQILLARISSVLKRSYNANGTDKITYKGLTLDLSRSIIKYGDKVADLTKNEVKILYLFLQKRGVIISRNEIMDYLWQSDNFIDDNTLTVNINRIRKKLSNIGIENFLITKKRAGVYDLKISEYLKDKLVGVILILVSIGIMDCVLYVVDLGILETCIIDGLFMLTYLITLFVEYIRKNSFYKTLLKSLNNLDKKFLLSEVIESPNFLEGKILYECEKEVNKSMNDEIFRYNKQSKEYREYIETWVHEVKTPIASSKLIIENNKNEVTESLLEEIEKIEYFVEQTLFYSRSNNVEKDYIITKISLKDIVNPVIRKNSKYLIARGVKIDISNLDIEVYTDKKWIEFIVNQVLNNGIKYTYKDPVFKIYGREEKDKVILIIKDNGVGISEKDIGRIFDKGFTGNNGRESAKSTGLGLYLCRKLANKLGLAINVYSKEYVGTEVEIVFPKGELFEV